MDKLTLPKRSSENADNGRGRQKGHEHLRPERITVSEGNLVRFAHRSDEPVIVQLWLKNSRNSRSNAAEQGARRQRRTVLSVVSRQNPPGIRLPPSSSDT